jgi:hypothetical protein
MRSRRIGAIVLGAGLIILGGASSASADSAPGGGAFIGPDGDPTATAGDGGSSGGGGGGGGGVDNCEWMLSVEDDFVFYVYGDHDIPQHSATGRWFTQVCDGTTWAFVPEGGLVDPRQVAEDALASVGIAGPVLGTSPDADRLVVRVPSWLWVDSSWWQSYSATASAGRVTATVTVRPVATEWSTGDGDATTCSGPGVVWSPGMADSATDCSHTYLQPSTGETGSTFPLTATVRMEVTWSSNTGQGGILPAISRSSTQPVTVTEIQAVGTR